jgi:hypothetical protein
LLPKRNILLKAAYVVVVCMGNNHDKEKLTLSQDWSNSLCSGRAGQKDSGSELLCKIEPASEVHNVRIKKENH